MRNARMSRQRLVLNEWVLHDLAGTQAARRTAFQLLKRIEQLGDQIAVLRGSPWIRKAYGLMKYTDPESRMISKFLQRILRDPNLCRIVESAEVPELSEDVKQRTPPDDVYLIETYLAADATVLVTTDHPLFDAFHNTSISIRLKDGFLEEYLRKVD